MAVNLRKKYYGKKEVSKKNRPYRFQLDYSHQGKRVRETIKDVEFLPTDTKEIRKQKERIVNKIKADLEIDLANQSNGLISRQLKKASFIKYFQIIADTKSPNTKGSWNNTLKHIEAFHGSKLKFEDVTERWLERFSDYLSKRLSQNSTRTYLQKTNTMTKHNPNSAKSTGRILIGIIAFIIFIFYMGSDERMAKQSSTQTRSSKQKSEVKNDINYDLQEYQIIPKVKYSANIRLDNKITKRELEYIANDIYRKKNIKSYQRAFLSYYLPNMEIGNGAWATTHFNPNLKVIILGLNIEEGKVLIKNKINPKKGQKIIGEWFDEYSQYRLTIYKVNNKVFGRYLHTDGSEETNQLIIKGDLIFDNKKYGHGEYYKLSRNNNLSIYDNEGYIYSFKKIR